MARVPVIMLVILTSAIAYGLWLGPPRPRISTAAVHQVVEQHVRNLDAVYFNLNGRYMTDDQKHELVDRIIKNMKDAKVYDFVK